LKAILLILALALGSAATAPGRPLPEYWLFAWSVRGGAIHFAVVRESERRAFLATFPVIPALKTIADLEAQINTLPKGTTVGWTDDACLGIRFPANDIMHRVEKFAASKKIELTIIPGACD
jgi:hypothetical protein